MPPPDMPLTALSNASIGDMNTQLKLANQNMSLLIQTVSASVGTLVLQIGSLNTSILAINTTISSVFPRISGTLTLSGTATTTVTQPAVATNSIISWTPLNAAAGTIEGSAKKLFLSAQNVGSNFVLKTSNAGTTAGTESFQYWIWNPI